MLKIPLGGFIFPNRLRFVDPTRDSKVWMPIAGIKGTFFLLQRDPDFRRDRPLNFWRKYEDLRDLNSFPVEMSFDFVLGCSLFESGDRDFPKIALFLRNSFEDRGLARASDRSYLLIVACNCDPILSRRSKLIGLLGKSRVRSRSFCRFCRCSCQRGSRLFWSPFYSILSE